MIDDKNGHPVLIGKNVSPDDPRAPLEGVFVAHRNSLDGGPALLEFGSKQEALVFILEFYATVAGHEVTDPFDAHKELEPLTEEEAARVDEVLARQPSPWAPSAAERVRAVWLYQERLRRDGTPQTWEKALFEYCRDIGRQQNTPAAVNALVGYGIFGLIQQGERNADEIRAHIDHDLRTEQEIAFDDWKANNDD